MDGCDALPNKNDTARQYRDESARARLQLAASDQHHWCKTADGGDPLTLNDAMRRSFTNPNNKKTKKKKSNRRRSRRWQINALKEQ